MYRICGIVQPIIIVGRRVHGVGVYTRYLFTVLFFLLLVHCVCGIYQRHSLILVWGINKLEGKERHHQEREVVYLVVLVLFSLLIRW